MNGTLMAVVAGLMACTTAMAQDDSGGKLKSYSYVEAQGGVQMTLTDAKMDKLITPVGALSFGHYFTHVVGARLHVNGWQAKSGFNDLGFYKWNFITTDADLLLNLTNLVSSNKSGSHPLNVILLGGIGLTNAWHNGDANTMYQANRTLNMPLVWSGNRLSHNIRAGLRLETNVTKPIGVSLEVAANSLDDRFNSKMNDADDWMITGMVGVSFRFGHKYTKAAPVPVPVVTETPKPAKVPVVKTRTIEKKEPVNIHEEAFFNIREAGPVEMARMQRIADFLKTYPNATVNITGYADKGTGNPTINMKYSQDRADNFKKELVDKYGADGSRISTDAKGDTVQPFTENDKNRCVIVDGKGEKTVTETVQETVYEEAAPSQQQ